MTNIDVYGCSWTRGVPPDWFSWSREFAKMHPNYQINDFSIGGTSIQWAYHQMLSRKNESVDLKIFQITAPFRYTMQHGEFFLDKRRKQLSNYSYYSQEAAHGILAFTFGYIPCEHKFYSKEHVEIAYKIWTDSMDYEQLISDYCIYVEKIAHEVDLCFVHNKYEYTEIKNRTGMTPLCIELELGSEVFNSHKIDNGNHLDHSGCQKVAMIIEKKLEEIRG